MTKIWILVLVSLLDYLFSTVVDITGKKNFCLYKKFPVGELHLSAEFVAESEETNNIHLYDPDDNELIKKRTLHYISENFKLNKTGEYRLCFLNYAGSEKKTVSFYYLMTELEEEQQKIIGPDTIYIAAAELSGVRQILNQISKNQHMRVETNSAHAETLNTVSTRIKICTIFKIIMALTVSICQLVVLRNFFRDKSNKSGFPGQEMF